MSDLSGKIFNLTVFKRLLNYVKPFKRIFYTTLFLIIILGYLGPARVLLIQYTIDNSVMKPNLDLLLQLTILTIFVLIIETLVQFSQTYYANWLGQNVIKNLREETFKKITGFRLNYFDQTPIGTLVARVINDIETIADVFSNGILIIIGDLLKLAVVVCVMFYMDIKLTLLSLASIPMLIIATRIFNRAIKSAFVDVRNQVAQLSAFVQEHLTGMNVIQIFNREKKEYDKFKAINKRHRNAHIKTVWAIAVFFPVVEILSAVSLALVVWIGAKGVINDSVSYGDLVAFILYIHMLFRPIRQLADRFTTLQMGLVSSERVFKILDTDSKINDNGKTVIKAVNGNIEFKNIWFAYNNRDWVLRDINFDVSPGEKVAIVGSTGAGKSSIINLLGRFYEFQKGAIYVDGNKIEDIDIQSLRSTIGVVVQDVFLFSDTIFNNITLNNTDISLEDVRGAAKKIGADDFIMKLPKNYAYRVGERGAMLSVGQRQLLAFIRVYLYNPKILILDEATSSIDTDSEELIQKAIDKITQGRTSIIIAHRLSTIKKSDRIIVIEKGSIVENASHSQLVNKNGYYKKLLDMQVSDNL